MSERNGALTREAIVAQSNRKVTRLDVPGWGDGHVYIRTLSVRERMSLQPDGDTTEDNLRAMAKVFVLGVCDAEGERLFGDDDIDMVLDMHDESATWMQVASSIASINCLTAEHAEELEKNLRASGRKSLSTSSRSRSARRSKKSRI